MDNYSFAFAGPGLRNKARSFVSQFSDTFSAFSKFIAPSYYHDRCERSVQMRLYSLNKRQFVLVFVTFFVCFLISVLVGIAGPHIIDSHTVNGSLIYKEPQNKQTGPFILHSPPMSTFHQQLWLKASVTVTDSIGSKFEQEFTMGILIRGGNGDSQSVEESSTNPQLSLELHNRTRKLKCSGTNCDDLIVMHLGYLDFAYYYITVIFYDLDVNKLSISNVKFTFKSYNPSFTQTEIWIRFVFLVITFIMTCWYSHSLRKFSIRDWSTEQKWMSLLLPLLLLYDDPIFPLTFLVNSWLPGMLDGLFQASFLCALLLFWLCIYHSVRQTDRHFIRFYLPKLIIVGLIWLCAVILASWQEYNELQDPTYYYRLDTTNFEGFKVMFFIFGGFYLLYLLYLLVRAFAELRLMPFFDLRLKFMTALMIIVVSISITITVMRFGGGALQDNFVSELATNYENSAEFVSFYGLLNFYLYTMAFVYSPSPNAMFETHFKDNPTLSMLNDSDEEVHYSSDTEETSLSRNRNSLMDSDDETARLTSKVSTMSFIVISRRLKVCPISFKQAGTEGVPMGSKSDLLEFVEWI
ncbi:transmembrane protein 181 [Biomphalaria pfeifferi]|uniref:Transmembrane protein 181 n=1 Tax=Biomphalaria pfeifferi TaxID=112525 RepID=A0AAD8FD78_BIOPF|nr:transmembrane protein 181 [Biomphalaria pfeifferi]